MQIDPIIAALLCTATLAAGPASADPSRAEDAPEPVRHVHHHGPSEGGGDLARRHHVMVMAAPGVADAGGAFFSSGVGYEYRLPYLHDAFGVGAMAEVMMMSSHHPHQMLMAFGAVHPFRGLYVQTAIGASHVHDRTTAPTSSGRGMRTEAVFRVSTGYDIHVGSMMIAPQVNADFGGSSTRAISAGLCIGRMF